MTAPDSLPAGFRVLVTRPQQQAAELVEAIESRGGKAVVFPCIEIVARPAHLVASDAAKLPGADITIFISRNAALFGAAHASGEIASIGPTTARALERAGFAVAICPQSGFDSEHLLAEAPFRDIAGKTVRIVRGNPGRELLATALRSRGARVDYLQAYERRQPRPPEPEVEKLAKNLIDGDIDAIVVMSVETFENLVALLPAGAHAALAGTPLVSPAARVIKNVLDRFPANPATQSGGPRASDIVDTLASLAANSTTRPRIPD